MILDVFLFWTQKHKLNNLNVLKINLYKFTVINQNGCKLNLIINFLIGMKESPSSNIKVAGNFIYKTNDVLGVGTWGTVYKARAKDENDHKWYAVKKINKFKV